MKSDKTAKLILTKMNNIQRTKKNVLTKMKSLTWIGNDV